MAMVLPCPDSSPMFSSATVSAMVVTNAAGTIVLCNAAAHRLLDRPGVELVGADLGRPLVARSTTDIDVVMQNGRIRAVEMQVTDTMWGSERAYVIALRDIDDLMQAGRQLVDNTQGFEAVFEDSPMGLAIVDQEFRFTRVNRALCRMLGYTSKELTKLRFVDVTRPEDLDAELTLISRLLSGETRWYELDKLYVTKDGEKRWGHVTTSIMKESSTTSPDFMAIVEDINEQKACDARATYLAFHDDLTDLPNRALAMDRLQLAQNRADRAGIYVGLLLIDLDGFKLVNDALGHDAGNELLVQVAKRLKAVLRPSDTAARLGGDEFLVCCEDLGTDDLAAQGAAIAVVERIYSALAVPIDLSRGATRVTVSIGVALVRGISQPADMVLRNADSAMYRAKERGRARFELFDEALQIRADERLALAAQLRTALQQGELVVYYQPMVSLEDGHIVGAEALLRWKHPDRGLLLPGEFLDVAEESGLIVPIGDWVLKQACAALAGWRRTEGRDLVVAVNASARQLGHDRLGTSVREALADSGLEPSALNVELTEGTLIQAGGVTLAELKGIRELGVHLSLDDFGTGYASLTYLRRLPVDFVKVDQSFVAGLGACAEDEAIVKAVVNLARVLGLEVIAEGVETAAHAAALKDMGCGYAQGWLFGHPQPAADFDKLLTSS